MSERNQVSTNAWEIPLHKCQFKENHKSLISGELSTAAHPQPLGVNRQYSQIERQEYIPFTLANVWDKVKGSLWVSIDIISKSLHKRPLNILSLEQDEFTFDSISGFHQKKKLKLKIAAHIWKVFVGILLSQDKNPLSLGKMKVVLVERNLEKASSAPRQARSQRVWSSPEAPIQWPLSSGSHQPEQ